MTNAWTVPHKPGLGTRELESLEIYATRRWRALAILKHDPASLPVVRAIQFQVNHVRPNIRPVQLLCLSQAFVMLRNSQRSCFRGRHTSCAQ